MNKILKGDEVIVLVGKDKGRRGQVLQRVDEFSVKVDGVNLVKRATKPNPAKNEVGGMVEKPLPVDISNIAIFNPTTKKADRVGFKIIDGKKTRIFKSSGEVIAG